MQLTSAVVRRYRGLTPEPSHKMKKYIATMQTIKELNTSYGSRRPSAGITRISGCKRETPTRATMSHSFVARGSGGAGAPNAKRRRASAKHSSGEQMSVSVEFAQSDLRAAVVKTERERV
jgi:hypothetical protein